MVCPSHPYIVDANCHDCALIINARLGLDCLSQDEERTGKLLDWVCNEPARRYPTKFRHPIPFHDAYAVLGHGCDMLLNHLCGIGAGHKETAD